MGSSFGTLGGRVFDVTPKHPNAFFQQGMQAIFFNSSITSCVIVT
jgi:hypothetical protein